MLSRLLDGVLEKMMGVTLLTIGFVLIAGVLIGERMVISKLPMENAGLTLQY